MSTTIQIKRSSTASAVPVSGDLAVGELAVNLADKRLFAKQADGTIIELSTNPTDLDAATLRIDGVEITASATELNSLDGLTATTAELNILDGVTATATEINKLDGYTGSTAELNFLDGVTSNIQTQLDAKASSTTSPTITLSGDLSGSATLTNLGSATLTATVADDSHNHVISNVDGLQTALDGKATSAQGALADTAVQPNDNVTFGTGDFTGSVDVTGTVTADAVDTTSVSCDGLTVDGATEMTGDRAGGSVGGTTLIKGYYTNGHNHFNLGSMYSAGANLLGYGVESSKSAPDSFISTLSNYSAPRSAIVSGEDVEILTASAQATAVGSPVTMSKRMKLSNNGDVHLYEDTGTTAKFVWDASAENLSINSSGAFPLSLDSTHGETILKLDNSSTNGRRYWLISGGSSGSFAGGKFGVYDADSLSVPFLIDSSGNVGIGTASPDEKLTVSGKTKASEFRASSGSGAKGYDFTASGSGAGLANMFCPSGFTLAFGTNNTERARIDSSGNLLVGTTTASHTVAGTVFYGTSGFSSTRANDQVGLLNRTGSDGTILNFRKDGTTVGSIGVDNSDNLYITGNSSHAGLMCGSTEILPYKGTTLNDGVNDIGASSFRWKDLYLSGGVITSSDYRLKEDIQPMQSYVDTVKQMNLVNFAWKDTGEREDGFIAHELQALVPSAVRGDKDAVDEDGEEQYQGVDPLKLIPVLTKALQEALQRIEALEAKL